MIYLSQLILNPVSRMVQNECRNPYEMHRTLMRGFAEKRKDVNVLHRLDVNPYSGVMALLVQSTIEPNWQPLTQVGQGDYLLTAPQWKVVELNLPNGRILQFRLTANPSKRLSTGKGNKPGPRIAFYKEQEQCAWLRQKGEAHGFRLLDVQASHAQKQTSRQKGITLHTVQYNGRLQITDAAKFITAVQTGIGPAKAFGCGLLSLAPG